MDLLLPVSCAPNIALKRPATISKDRFPILSYGFHEMCSWSHPLQNVRVDYAYPFLLFTFINLSLTDF